MARNFAADSVDQFYTPPSLAKELLGHVEHLPEGSIADFAAGEGELLKQAHARWPSREVIAADLSRVAADSLTKTWPSWRVSCCDFFSARSRAASSTLRREKGRVALCVANPPFSFRGTKGWYVAYEGHRNLVCSPAMAFLLAAIEYLGAAGTLLAIIPSNSLRSQKDKSAIDLMTRLGSMSILKLHPRGTFAKCSSETVSIRFQLGKSHVGYLPQASVCQVERLEVRLMRGSTPMYRTEAMRPGLLPLIHTTDLQNHRAAPSSTGVLSSRRILGDPAVLLPRVGRPSKGKVALFLGECPSVLSDCLFALVCTSHSQAMLVLNRLIDNWTILESCYHGTCAPYISVNDLRGALARIGISERHEASQLGTLSVDSEQASVWALEGATLGLRRLRR